MEKWERLFKIYSTIEARSGGFDLGVMSYWNVTYKKKPLFVCIVASMALCGCHWSQSDRRADRSATQFYSTPWVRNRKK